MAIKTRGTNHPALIGRNYDETVDFYTRVLGMRLVLEQPNLDDPENSVHLFFETGPGNFIAYFVPKEGSLPETPRRRQLGGLLHIAIDLDVPIEEAMATLDAEGVRYKGPIDRGYERSIYFRDPNGAVIELLSWIEPLPEGADEGDVILAAQRHRIERGAPWIDLEDVEAVMDDFR